MSEQKTLGGEKFLPVFFVNEVKIGDTFTSEQWPLHLTLFPPLETPYLASNGQQMRTWVNPLSPFTVTTGEAAMFGPAEDIPVRTIESNDTLLRVHKGLVRALARLDHDPQYRMPYNPHISQAIDTELIGEGESLRLEGLSIAVQKKRLSTTGEIMKTWEVVDKMRFKGPINQEYESAGEYE